MTSDGFKDNLKWIANECIKIAKHLRVTVKFKAGNQEAIKKVLDELFQKNEKWLFLDSPHNPSWIGYSAIMKLRSKILELYSGYEEYLDETIKLKM